MKTIALAVIAASTSIAFANLIQASDLSQPNSSIAGTFPVTLIIEIDISGLSIFDFQGSQLNEILSIQLFPSRPVLAIGWDINLSTIGTSWASEVAIGFENYYFLLPAQGDDFSVSNMNYSSDGLIDFSDNGQPNIELSHDGILDIEFFDSSFLDNGGTGEAFFEAGSTISIGIYDGIIPSPSSPTLIGFGCLIAVRRKR